MQSRIMKTDTDKVTEIMADGHIPGASATMIDGDEKIPPTLIGNDLAGNKVTADTKFGVASLSKPVFAYLVLKLIEDNKPGNTPKFFEFKKAFDLKTPLHSIVPSMRLNGCKNKDAINAFNVLSHQTGLHIKDTDFDNKIKPFVFEFEPGSGKYSYSNTGITYLQEVIEELTGKKLAELAKKVVFDELNMTNSEFVARDPSKPTITYAACDLQTTPTDYANFMLKWRADPGVNYAFKTAVKMTKDDWAIALNVPQNDLEHVSWGLGIALQLDNQGNPIRAFHTGDMDPWRAAFAMDLTNNKVVVLCSNGLAGHMLIEPIVSQNVELTHGLNFFLTKFCFAKNIERGYELHHTSELSDSAPKEKAIYIEPSTLDNKNALEFLLVNKNGVSEKFKITLDRLPAFFPKELPDIINSKDPMLATYLLEFAMSDKIGKYLDSKVKPINSTASINTILSAAKPANAAEQTKEPKDELSTKTTLNTEQKAPSLTSPSNTDSILPTEQKPPTHSAPSPFTSSMRPTPFKK